MRRIAAVALGLIGLAVPALAQDASVDIKPLTGTYYMGPALDAEDAKAPADHVYMTVTGDAAKAMYQAMQAEPTPDECVGRMAKWVQGLVCYGAPTDNSSTGGAPPDSPFECYLGINLKSAALEPGQDC